MVFPQFLTQKQQKTQYLVFLLRQAGKKDGIVGGAARRQETAVDNWLPAVKHQLLERLFYTLQGTRGATNTTCVVAIWAKTRPDDICRTLIGPHFPIENLPRH